MKRFLAVIGIGLGILFGTLAPSQANKAYYQPFPSQASVGTACNSDITCGLLYNIAVGGITYSGSSGVVFYTWQSTCGGSPDGVFYYQPVGASVGCFKMGGFATSAVPLTNSLTSAHILVGSSGNVATDRAVSGDVAITNTGATTVNKVLGGSTPVTTSRVITAGNGLGGGGDLSADRTIAITAPVSYANGGTNSTTNPIYVSTASIAALSALANPSTVAHASVIGYYSGSTFGGGNFDYSTTGTVDGCNVVAASDGKYWVRQQSPTLNIDSCGAKGDGTTNDAAAVSAALSVSTNITCSAGKTYLIGTQITISTANVTINGNGCNFNPNSAASVFDIEASGFTGQNISFRATNGGLPLLIGNSATISRIKLLNLTCDGSNVPSPPMSDCIHIGNVTDFMLNGFFIKTAGYGVLQISGTHSHDVVITNFHAADMYADMAEENSVTAGTTNWNISNGTFDGSHGYPSLATEQRFAGFTGSSGIVISNVQVSNANGDSCIHFEGFASNIKLSNVSLTGCLGEFIEWNNSNNGITAVNVTCNFTASGQAPNCFSGVGNAYSNYLFATNTWCNDTSGTAGLTCFDLTQHIGTANITGGGGSGIGTFVSAFSTQDVTVTGTTVFAVNGWLGPSGSSSKPSHDIKLSGNKWTCSNWCLFEQNNTGLTTFPTNWSVTGNWFDGGAGSHGVDVNQGKNVWGTGNWYGSTPTNHTVADNPNTATTEKNDFLQGSGLIHP